MATEQSAFQSKVALITGASSGIGRAIALDLARQGAELLVVGRRAQVLAELSEEVKALGTSCRAFHNDLAHAESLRELCQTLRSHLQWLDILVHSAGTVTLSSVEETSLADLDLNYHVNLRAPFVLTGACTSALKAAKGQVVYINSGAGLNANRTWGAYAASKHGLKALADAYRHEVKGAGIRVMSCYPGRTASPMQEQVRRLEGQSYHADNYIQPPDVSTMVCQALSLPRTADVVDINIRPA